MSDHKSVSKSTAEKKPTKTHKWLGLNNENAIKLPMDTS